MKVPKLTNRIRQHVIDGEKHISGARIYYLDESNVSLEYPGGAIVVGNLDLLKGKNAREEGTT